MVRELLRTLGGFSPAAMRRSILEKETVGRKRLGSAAAIAVMDDSVFVGGIKVEPYTYLRQGDVSAYATTIATINMAFIIDIVQGKIMGEDKHGQAGNSITGPSSLDLHWNFSLDKLGDPANKLVVDALKYGLGFVLGGEDGGHNKEAFIKEYSPNVMPAYLLAPLKVLDKEQKLPFMYFFFLGVGSVLGEDAQPGQFYSLAKPAQLGQFYDAVQALYLALQRL